MLLLYKLIAKHGLCVLFGCKREAKELSRECLHLTLGFHAIPKMSISVRGTQVADLAHEYTFKGWPCPWLGEQITTRGPEIRINNSFFPTRLFPHVEPCRLPSFWPEIVVFFLAFAQRVPVSREGLCHSVCETQGELC